MTDLPRDNEAHRFPVSVKGIVLRGDVVVLVKNRRGEWELPGGKLEPGEEPTECVAREIEEELQLTVTAVQVVDAWIYTIAEGIDVLVVSYGCRETQQRRAVISGEHTDLEWVALSDVDGLSMPDGYKTSIRRWAARADSR